jgi:drug/metabolite transporter (DMT)-like permease
MALGNLALLAVLATGFFSAFFDLTQKLLGRYLSPLPMVALLGLASLPLFAAPLVFLGLPAIGEGYWLPALVAALFHLLSHLAFIQSVRLADFSLTVPLLSLTPVFTTLIAWAMLGEQPDGRGAAGILLVVLGAALSQKPASFTWTAFAASWRARGPWLMIATAGLWSITLPLDKLAVAASGALFHGFFLTLAITVGASLALLLRREKLPLGELRRCRGLFWGAFVFCAAALGSQLFALSLTFAGVVETIKRGLGNLLAVLFGRLVFGEPMSGGKWLASLVMAAGVALILL